MIHLLIAVTGSVATIKLSLLVQRFVDAGSYELKIIATPSALKFIPESTLLHLASLVPTIKILTDHDESWSLGKPILHIELRKWADAILIAPLSANTLAKLYNGLADNLVTCTMRAWDYQKCVIVCPAMNTQMWNHPLTRKQLDGLVEWGVRVIEPIEKTLACGDVGMGAMENVDAIYATVSDLLCDL